MSDSRLGLALSPRLHASSLAGMLECCETLTAFGVLDIPDRAEAWIGTHPSTVDARWQLHYPTPSTTAAGIDRREAEVRFAMDIEVPWPFRGERMHLRLPTHIEPLTLQAGERALATMGHGVVWSVTDTHVGRIYRTALPLEPAAALDTVVAGADGDGVLDWLPLLHFLSSAGKDRQFERPPLRAGYIIDDPNLHWPRYGFADYQQIADDAARENYHVAFATIPLDAWFTHRRSAEIFRQHSQRLSLLVHGNDHGKQELARVPSSQAGVTLLHQALERILRLERMNGLSVCRVMVPPHGACSSDMLELLPRQGFDAACISAGSLKAHNQGQAWTRRLGLAPSEYVRGCPVLPRWAFTWRTPASLRLAAYLGKPLILRGHHQDLRDGLDVFRAAARAINGLGRVRWTALGEIARLNYRSRREGSRLHVQPLSNHVSVELPAGVTEVAIEGSSDDWVRSGVPPSSGSGIVTLDLRRRVHAAAVPIAAAPSRRTSSSLVLRRLLTEARDRLLV
jgi:hypothetical protein